MFHKKEHNNKAKQTLSMSTCFWSKQVLSETLIVRPSQFLFDILFSHLSKFGVTLDFRMEYLAYEISNVTDPFIAITPNSKFKESN